MSWDAWISLYTKMAMLYIYDFAFMLCGKEIISTLMTLLQIEFNFNFIIT